MKKFRLNIIILIIISFLVVYLTLKDDFEMTVNYILKLDMKWFFVSILFILLYILFQSISFLLFIKKVKPNYTLKDSYKLISSGLFFNAITPFSSGGQPFQIYILKKQGVKISDSSNILLQNFITFQLSLILIGTFAIVYNLIYHIFPNYNMLKNVVFIGYIVNLLVLIIIVFLSYAKKFNTALFNKILNLVFKLKFIKNKDKKRDKINEVLDNFYNGSNNLKKNYKLFFKSLLLNTLSLISLYVIPIFIFMSMGDDSLGIINSIVSSGYTFLIGSFVPIPGAAGGLEYAFNEFFSIYEEAAFISASLLLWRFVTYYFGMILGGIILMFDRKEADEK